MTPLVSLALVVGVIALASLVSARLAVAAALVELAGGVALAACTPVDARAPWLVLLASLGGAAITFLAGTQLDPGELRRTPGPALALGGAAFLATFGCAWVLAQEVLGWSAGAALVAALVLAETSLAVTYAVLLDLGLVGSALGRLVMSAVFVTDVAAAVVLSVVIARPSWPLFGFAAASCLLILALPRLLRRVEAAHPGAASGPGLRLVVLALVVLLVLAQHSGGVAVLPAFLLGLACARHYRGNPEAAATVRTVVMTFVAPFFFVRAGLGIAPAAVLAGGGAVVLLFAVKVVPRWAAAYLVARRLVPDRAPAVACLMSTGLTFGMVIALAGRDAGMIDPAQFSVLAAAVVGAAVLPAWAGQTLLRGVPTPRTPVIMQKSIWKSA